MGLLAQAPDRKVPAEEQGVRAVISRIHHGTREGLAAFKSCFQAGDVAECALTHFGWALLLHLDSSCRSSGGGDVREPATTGRGETGGGSSSLGGQQLLTERETGQASTKAVCAHKSGASFTFLLPPPVRQR